MLSLVLCRGSPSTLQASSGDLSPLFVIETRAAGPSTVVRSSVSRLAVHATGVFKRPQSFVRYRDPSGGSVNSRSFFCVDACCPRYRRLRATSVLCSFVSCPRLLWRVHLFVGTFVRFSCVLRRRFESESP
ncbi:hypothetical protein GN244_ATG00057 [Phytophthora infestans]|uniref:Uncharacterized protein n=1 Tax=Phytophthora infestans TaxID=4787 RepID=A0A833T5E8_PHYIN|nr:hypothetical protein GN244_ATG00057 [Phytophthora infestans]